MALYRVMTTETRTHEIEVEAESPLQAAGLAYDRFGDDTVEMAAMGDFCVAPVTADGGVARWYPDYVAAQASVGEYEDEESEEEDDGA